MTHCGTDYKTLGTLIYGGGATGDQFTQRVTIVIEILDLVGKTGDILVEYVVNTKK